MKRVLLVLAAGLGVSACATSKATLNSYVDPNFDATSVESVALLPSRNPSLAPSEARQITRSVAQGIHQRSPNVRILGPTEAAQALNDAGLADTWAVYLSNYAASGIPDAEVLRLVGDVLDVDVIVQGELVDVYQVDGVYGGNKGQTRVTVRFTMLDCQLGRLMWEASSDGIKTTATTLDGAPPIIEAVELAVDKLISSMPRMGRIGGS